MKTTTDSQLAEQAYQDFLATSESSDKKRDVCFMYNQYALHYGLPTKLEFNSPDKYAKLCFRVLMYFARELRAVKHQSEFGKSRNQSRSCTWMAEQVKETWGLGDVQL